jgi:hypothetical protein
VRDDEKVSARVGPRDGVPLNAFPLSHFFEGSIVEGLQGVKTNTGTKMRTRRREDVSFCLLFLLIAHLNKGSLPHGLRASTGYSDSHKIPRGLLSR